MIPPLAGHTVAVTGDRRADQLASHLEALGAATMRASVVRTEPTSPDAGALWAATAALIACPPEVLVATTAVGMRTWLDAAEVWGLRRDLLRTLAATRIVGRGPKVVGALHAAGLPVWHAQTAPPHVAPAVERLVRGGVRGARVAVQVPGDDDSVAIVQLRAAGANVVAVRAYGLGPPDDAVAAGRVVRAVVEGRVSAVTFTSRAAVRHFLELAARAGLDTEIRRALTTAVAAVCVGDVTADELRRRAGAGVAATTPADPTIGALARHVGDLLRARDHHHVLGPTGEVVVQGRMIDHGADRVLASEREAAVLGLLVRAPRRVVAADTLLRRVWSSADVDASVLDTTILRLRRRLRRTGLVIETVRRRGYVLEADAAPCLTAGSER